MGHKGHPGDKDPTEEQRAKSKPGLPAASPLLTLQPAPLQLVPGEQPRGVLGCGPCNESAIKRWCCWMNIL